MRTQSRSTASLNSTCSSAQDELQDSDRSPSSYLFVASYAQHVARCSRSQRDLQPRSDGRLAVSCDESSRYECPSNSAACMTFGMNYSSCPTVYLIHNVTAMMVRAMYAPVRPAHSAGEARQINDHQRETDVRVVVQSQLVERIRSGLHQPVSHCLRS